MMTLQQAYNDFILSRKLANLAPKTVSNYEQFLSPFVAFCGSHAGLETLTQDILNQYLSNLLDKPVSRSTKSTHIRHVKVFLRWVQQEQPVPYDYKKIRVPKSPKKKVKIYTGEELRQIMSCICTNTDWLTLRNKCLVAMMYDSGLRQSELCTLLKSYVTYSENRMTVSGKGNKERTVPLGNLTARLLKEYLALCPYDSDRVFVNRHGKPLTGNAVKLLISKISSRLDFEFSSHKLRHNFATNYCIDQYERFGRVDIYQLMFIMGHEDIETTKRYLHHAKEILSTRNCISHLDMVFGMETDS